MADNHYGEDESRLHKGTSLQNCLEATHSLATATSVLTTLHDKRAAAVYKDSSVKGYVPRRRASSECSGSS